MTSVLTWLGAVLITMAVLGSGGRQTKSVLAWLGAALIIMAVLGALGPFDFKVCFGPKDYCNPVP